jgi:hypothetical protein
MAGQRPQQARQRMVVEWGKESERRRGNEIQKQIKTSKTNTKPLTVAEIHNLGVKIPMYESARQKG